MNVTIDNMNIVFQRQSVKHNIIEMKFESIVEFNIKKKKEFIHELFEASMFFKNEYIYWASSIQLEDANCTWICAKKAMWREL